MNDKKEVLKCDECGEILKTGIPDQDSRGFIYCRSCGLCYEPGHEMGRGFTGLKDYMIHKGFNDHINNIRLAYKIEGLAKARLMVSKL
jgi:hypothetical protein